MALLLDTHVLIWMAGDERRLSAPARAALAAAGQGLNVSAVTAWEFEGLARRGRLGRVGSFEELVSAFRLVVLDLPGRAWEMIGRLPDLHRDPIDRMTIAHAMIADLSLVTADSTIQQYPVRTIW